MNGERLAERWPRLFGAGAEGARAMLSAIASSMITVAGVTFSITVVAHPIAASIQATSIMEAAAGETFKAVDRLFPADVGEAAVEHGSDAKTTRRAGHEDSR